MAASRRSQQALAATSAGPKAEAGEPTDAEGSASSPHKALRELMAAKVREKRAASGDTTDAIAAAAQGIVARDLAGNGLPFEELEGYTWDLDEAGRTWQEAGARTFKEYKKKIYDDRVAGCGPPYVLKSSPNVLSLGRRCVVDGYTFVWPPHSMRPYFIKPNGEKIYLRVEDYCPYLDDPGGTSLTMSSAVACACQRASRTAARRR